MNIENFFSEKRALIEDNLEKLIICKDSSYEKLFDSAKYSLLNGGKRIRPILCLATCLALGGKLEDALIPSLAIELIHTYSLIHDDLPCMDNDDYRRGKPTLHIVYSEAGALLTGDFFLTHAFELLANSPTLDADMKIELIKTLSANAGINGMIGGQFMDIESDNLFDLKHLQKIHRSKTGALIVASCDFGATIAKASKEEREIVKSFAQDMGLAFQIIDDVLDITASVDKRGQTLSSDIKNQKTTYATLLGQEKAEKKAYSLLESAKKKLSSLHCDTSILKDISEYIVCRKN